MQGIRNARFWCWGNNFRFFSTKAVGTVWNQLAGTETERFGCGSSPVPSWSLKWHQPGPSQLRDSSLVQEHYKPCCCLTPNIRVGHIFSRMKKPCATTINLFKTINGYSFPIWCSFQWSNFLARKHLSSWSVNCSVALSVRLHRFLPLSFRIP